MRTALLTASALALSMLAGCPAAPPASSGTTTAPRPSAAPAAYTCAPGAYTHTAPDFCLELPAAARAEAPTMFEGGMSWKGITVQWAPKSDAAKIAGWKKVGPAAQHKGTFEVLASEPFAAGTLHTVYNATQHEVLDIYKVPHVEAFAVVEGADFAVRCSALHSLGDKRDDAREARRIAEAHAADFAVCKTLRVR
jgi:hypothetical protein